MLDWKRTCNLYERCSVLLCCHYCEQFYRFINRLLPWSMSTFLFLMSVYELKSTDHVRQLQWTNNDLSRIVSLLIPFRINDLIHWFRLICKEQSVSLYLFTFLSSIHMLPQSFHIYNPNFPLHSLWEGAVCRSNFSYLVWWIQCIDVTLVLPAGQNKQSELCPQGLICLSDHCRNVLLFLLSAPHTSVLTLSLISFFCTMNILKEQLSHSIKCTVTDACLLSSCTTFCTFA